MESNSEITIKKCTNFFMLIYSTELGKEKLRQMLAQVSKIRGTPKSYRRNKDKFYTPNTQIHDRSLSWHGTGTSIKRGKCIAGQDATNIKTNYYWTKFFIGEREDVSLTH
jgi:hypothetical protein